MPSSVNCLLVDDRPENLHALSAVLQTEGVNILTASSGAEALEHLLTQEVALAILDVQMPEMDGFELAELMRASSRTHNIPIIFITASHRDEQRQFAGYELGAVDFLYKPVDPAILSRKAAVFFELYRQRAGVSEELEARTEMLRMNELFMAVLGHDLRNPLHNILLNAHLLREPRDPALVERAAQDIQRAGARMNRMIDDLLDVARLRFARGFEIRRAPENLVDILQAVAAEQRPLHPGCQIEVVLQGDLTGSWDHDRLLQAFGNLIGNALQHGCPSGAVPVKVEAVGGTDVMVRISNPGTIAPEQIGTLFDPFKSAASQAPRRHNLGLGLYIAQHIVTAHGGEIRVRSEEGMTRFEVRLPRG
jgi:signal transduction histidine kinase